MLSITTKILAFVVGTFLVWHLGRKRFYDEEKLIDLVVFSTAVGVVGGWLVSLAVSKQFSIFNSQFSIFRGVWINWRAAITSGTIFAVMYLRRLHWPLWPPLGFLAVGASAAWLLLALLSPFFIFNFSFLIFSALTFVIIFYIVELGGDDAVRSFWGGFKAGFERRKRGGTAVKNG